MKGLLLHAVLALGGLLLAYLVWTEDDPAGRAREEVTVWGCDADQVTAVRLESERARVELERRGKGDDAHWWVVHESRPENREPVTKRFAGGEKVDDYLSLIAPLRAVRELGELEGDVLAEVGLAEGGDELEIACGGKRRTFVAGENAFGSGDRYVRDARGGPVYLLDANVVRDLQSAQVRLMQRKLHTFAWSDVARLTVEGQGAERTLLQRNRHDMRQAEWVDAAQPDRRNELYGNWLSRVRRLSVSEYLAPDASPGAEGAEVQPVATLRFEDGDGKPVGRWELVRAVRPSEVRYLARSDATHAWVELPTSLAKQVAHDVRPVLGLEPEEEPEPAAPPAPEEPADEEASEGGDGEETNKSEGDAKAGSEAGAAPETGAPGRAGAASTGGAP
ncbi:MAG: DUF4340 domain-containing protein [Myxococcota bacterium]